MSSTRPAIQVMCKKALNRDVILVLIVEHGVYCQIATGWPHLQNVIPFMMKMTWMCLFNARKKYNVELAIKNQGAIIIFQVHHHDFRGKQILITFSKALIKFAIDMLYYHFFWPKTPSRNNKLLQKPSRNKKKLFWARNFF